MMRIRTMLIAVPAAALATACSDATSPDVSSGLTRPEAQEIAYQLTNMNSSALGPMGSLPFSGFSTLRDSVSQTINRTVDCPQGGSMRVTGSVAGSFDAAAGRFGVRSNVTSAAAQCGVAAPAGARLSSGTAAGRSVKMNGEMRVTVESSGSWSGLSAGTVTFTSTTTQRGAFSYQTSEGSSGTCEVDVRSTVDLAARSYQVRGAVCGRTVDESRTLPSGFGGRS